MTWPEGIAAAIGVLTALLITRYQHTHRSTTAPPTEDPQDGDHRS